MVQGTVDDSVAFGPGRGVKTEKKCSACQVIKPASEYYVAPSKSTGLRSKCKDCEKGDMATYQRSPQGRFIFAKHQAKIRHAGAFDLAFDDFEKLIQKPCHYCGGPLNETGSGLDRMDSSLGYVSGNVVPCCWSCNRIKSDEFSHTEMLKIGAVLSKIKHAKFGVQSEAL